MAGWRGILPPICSGCCFSCGPGGMYTKWAYHDGPIKDGLQYFHPTTTSMYSLRFNIIVVGSAV
jgi:hypothetical protein